MAKRREIYTLCVPDRIGIEEFGPLINELLERVTDLEIVVKPCEKIRRSRIKARKAARKRK